MADNSQIKEHISVIERTKWDQVVVDFAKHLGAGGDNNHMRANGSVSGFSINDYTTPEKNKLAGIEAGANKYIHPNTHPYTIITGLAAVASSGNYNDLKNRPVFPSAANGCDAATVGGIKIFIQTNTPSGVTSGKAIWFDMSNNLVKIYWGTSWVSMCAVFG